MNNFAPLDALARELAERDTEGLRRRQRIVDAPCQPEVVVDGEPLLAFCSNDYLGLANHPRLITALNDGAHQWGTGSGASHLVSGHLRPHASVETALAAFVGLPAALLFSTGYMANLGIIPALVGRGDAVFSDRLNHASLIDAALLSRADHQRYPHGNLSVLAGQLSESKARRKLIVVDAVFSMDGDLADLPALLRLAQQHDAWLVIDDAHGFGALGGNDPGQGGRGSLAYWQLPADPRIVYMGTLGKAAGISGAFVAAEQTVIDWLIQSARTHIYTTAASPALSVAICESLKLIAESDARRAHLQALIARLRAGCAKLPWSLAESVTAIQPLIVGDNHTTLTLSQALRAKGFWVPAIRPPTVPAGTARLRITLSAAHNLEQVDALCAALTMLAQGNSA